MTNQEWNEQQARFYAGRLLEARILAEQWTEKAFPVGQLVRIELGTMSIAGKVHAVIEGDPSRVACLLEHGQVRDFSVDRVRGIKGEVQ